MHLTHRISKWYITDVPGGLDYGPYDTKAEAESDLHWQELGNQPITSRCYRDGALEE